MTEYISWYNYSLMNYISLYIYLYNVGIETILFLWQNRDNPLNKKNEAKINSRPRVIQLSVSE